MNSTPPSLPYPEPAGRPLRFTDLSPQEQQRVRDRMKVGLTAINNVVTVLKPKLSAKDLEWIRKYLVDNERAMALDHLCATLVQAQTPLTTSEHQLLSDVVALYDGGAGPHTAFLGDPVGVLAAVNVTDGADPPHPAQTRARSETFRPRPRAAHLRGRIGGHLAGIEFPRKATFPPSWDADKINAMVLDVARNPDEVPVKTRDGAWITRGTRDNVHIEVRLRPEGTIITGYPLSGLGVHTTTPDGTPGDPLWSAP